MRSLSLCVICYALAALALVFLLLHIPDTCTQHIPGVDDATLALKYSSK